MWIPANLLKYLIKFRFHSKNSQNVVTLFLLHYITLHYRHFKCHLHLKWPVVHQQLHVIRNIAHWPSTQASYTASWVRPKRKISCAAAQIAATLTISFPRWRHMSLTSYWRQQQMSLTSYSGLHKCFYKFRVVILFFGFQGLYYPSLSSLFSRRILESERAFSFSFATSGAHFGWVFVCTFIFQTSKREPSVFSLICSWLKPERAPFHQKLTPITMDRQLPDSDWFTSGWLS